MTIRSFLFYTFASVSLGLTLFVGCGGPKTEAIQNIPPMTAEELADEQKGSETSE